MNNSLSVSNLASFGGNLRATQTMPYFELAESVFFNLDYDNNSSIGSFRVFRNGDYTTANEMLRLTEDGNLQVAGILKIGGVGSPPAYNTIGTGAATHVAVGQVENASDLFVADDLEVDGNIFADGQIVSSVAAGTPPLVVTSTDVVTNLNADMLDGQHSTAFMAAGAGWRTTGNAATLGDFVGTTNTQPLDLSTNGIARVRVDGTTGWVTVGENSAASTNLTVKTYETSGGIVVNNANAAVGDPVVRFQVDGGSRYVMGVDDSDVNDPFKISNGADLGAMDLLTIDYQGYVSIGQSNVGTLGVNVTPNANYKVYASKLAPTAAGGGAGTASVYGYRAGSATASYGGTAWTSAGMDAGVKAYNSYGNNFSTAIGASGYIDFPESAIVMASDSGAAIKGALVYKDAGSVSWAGYFAGNVNVTGTANAGIVDASTDVRVGGTSVRERIYASKPAAMGLSSGITGTYQSIGTLASFAKTYDDTDIIVTFQSSFLATGAQGQYAQFELRIDGVQYTSNRPRVVIATGDTAATDQATITLYATGLASGTRTITLWLRGDCTTAYSDSGGWDNTMLLVREVKTR